jgi:hypothetical protein
MRPPSPSRIIAVLAIVAAVVPGAAARCPRSRRSCPPRRGQQVDVVGTTYNTTFRLGTPTQPMTTADANTRQSIHHVLFTGNNRVDFQKGRATPGVPG